MQTVLQKNSKAAWLLSLLVLGAGMTYILWGLLNCVDVPFGDDSMYLAFSKSFPHKVLPDYGPLYVGTYKLFSLFTKDLLVAYRMGMFAFVIIPTVALFIAGLSFRLPPVLAAIIAIAFLANPWILDYGFFNPMVSHPVIAWIFLWAAWAWKRTAFTQLVSSLLLCLIIVYYRPEHILTMAMIFGVLGLWMLVKWRERFNWKRVGIIVSVLIVIVLAFKVVGKPVGNSGKRSGLAFIQHVAINYLEWKGDPHPWENHVYFTDYLPEMLGVKTTKLENLPSDPKTLLKNSRPLLITHFTYNLKGFLNNWLKTPGLLLPPQSPLTLIYIVDALLIFLVSFKLYRDRKKLRGYWQTFTKTYGIVWLILFCFAVTSMAVSILIYPRVHYFLFSLPLFYFTAYLLVKWLLPAGKLNPRLNISLLVFALAYILMAPNVCSKAYMKIGGPDKSSTHIPAIETLWKLNIRDSVRILDRQMGIFLYMPENYRYVDFNMDKPFMQYVNDRKVNMIHVTSTLLSDKHYTSDPEFGFFIKNLEMLGWQSVPVPGTENKLWVKKELLKQ